MVNMTIDLGRGLMLRNPVMTASGTFGYGEEYTDFVDLAKLGGIIVKGTTLHPREGNPYPRMAETPSGMLNCVGLQNKGVQYFIDSIYPRIKDFDTNVLLNLSGSTLEDYVTGDYNTNTEIDLAELYEKYVKKFTSILPYQFGVWVTSYAFKNLFTLGKCVDTENGGVWLYSDTDSCYATKWDKEKINAYNENCKKKLEANGYSCVVYKDREYWLGVAEHDGSYSQFRTCGSKRYVVRYARTEENKKDKKAGKLKITVAGVPKKGVKCLKNNINNFSRTMVFDGKTTGKLQHTYFYEPQIWIDENENERGDSIDLSPTTYILDDVNVVDWESLFSEEVGMQIYYEGDFYEL